METCLLDKIEFESVSQNAKRGQGTYFF